MVDTRQFVYNHDEKCSWVVKAGHGGPSFKISALTGDMSQFDLHYAEYDDSVTK